MRSGIGNNAFLIAIIASLLIATRGHMAEASSKKAVTATKTIRTTSDGVDATAPFFHPTRACARRRDGREPRQN
jgi:hypothetical protein